MQRERRKNSDNAHDHNKNLIAQDQNETQCVCVHCTRLWKEGKNWVPNRLIHHAACVRQSKGVKTGTNKITNNLTIALSNCCLDAWSYSFFFFCAPTITKIFDGSVWSWARKKKCYRNLQWIFIWKISWKWGKKYWLFFSFVWNHLSFFIPRLFFIWTLFHRTFLFLDYYIYYLAWRQACCIRDICILSAKKLPVFSLNFQQ